MSAIARRRAAAASLASSPVFSSQQQQQQQQQQQLQQPPPQRMFTLQEVIAVMDSRLSALELGASNNQPPSSMVVSQTEEDLENLVQNLMGPHLEEFNHRYEILATEMLAVKNVVMKLQSYTLDVNKMLVDERIRVMADPVLAAVDEEEPETLPTPLDETMVTDATVEPTTAEVASVDTSVDDTNITFVATPTTQRKPRKKKA
jgi:hypothetical protein